MSSSLTSPCAKEARAQETWAQLQQRARENYYVNRKSRWDPVEWYARQGYNITEMERVANLTTRGLAPTSGTNVRVEEVAIVLVVLTLWAAAIALFINRWGKIRQMEPFHPYVETQAAAPSVPTGTLPISSSTSGLMTGAAAGQPSAQGRNSLLVPGASRERRPSLLCVLEEHNRRQSTLSLLSGGGASGAGASIVDIYSSNRRLNGGTGRQSAGHIYGLGNQLQPSSTSTNANANNRGRRASSYQPQIGHHSKGNLGGWDQLKQAHHHYRVTSPHPLHQQCEAAKTSVASASAAVFNWGLLSASPKPRRSSFSNLVCTTHHLSTTGASLQEYARRRSFDARTLLRTGNSSFASATMVAYHHNHPSSTTSLRRPSAQSSVGWGRSPQESLRSGDEPITFGVQQPPPPTSTSVTSATSTAASTTTTSTATATTTTTRPTIEPLPKRSTTIVIPDIRTESTACDVRKLPEGFLKAGSFESGTTPRLMFSSPTPEADSKSTLYFTTESEVASSDSLTKPPRPARSKNNSRNWRNQTAFEISSSRESDHGSDPTIRNVRKDSASKSTSFDKDDESKSQSQSQQKAKPSKYVSHSRCESDV